MARASLNETATKRTELALAAGAGAVTFGAYLATIYPGLLDIGDATKFAFVGKVLGTPHAPGYPLFVMVSYLFSFLPFGTLAYRMNVLSAVLASVTVGLGYLIARRLDVGRPAALSAALALGLGQAFWAKALYAKGYTLNAALVSGGILMLLRWNDSRRWSDFYWAVAIFALSIGNHLTVVALLPALVVFSLLTEPRTLRPKTVFVVLVLVLLGLSQYGLIIVRTLQQAPYMEARATNLRELWDVMTARRFANEIGAYSLPTLVATRVPLILGLIATELGPIGLPLVCVGLLVLLAGRRRHAALFGLGALGVASLTANMSSEEDQGFLLSVFALLWPVAAVGLQSAIGVIQHGPRRLAGVLTLGLAALLPAMQVMSNYRLNDHHAETFETDYFNALFAALPQKTAIVDDEYRLNMMVLYKVLGEGAAAGRDIRLALLNQDAVKGLHQNGFEVLAFKSARKDLEEFGFNFEPFTIPASGATRDIVGRRDIFRVISTPDCLDVGNQGWVDFRQVLQPRGRMNVKIDNYRPFDADLTIYAGTTRSLKPAVLAARGRGTPLLDAEAFARSDANARMRLATQLLADQLTLPNDILDAPVVERVRVQVNDNGASSSFALDLGGQTMAAIGRARVDQDSPKRAVMCTHSLGDVDALTSGQTEVTLSADAHTIQYDDGWYPTERRADGLTYRWMANRAALQLPLAHPTTATVGIEVEPLLYRGRGEQSMTLAVNGHREKALPVTSGRRMLSWSVPADHWREGLNEVAFEVDGAKRPSDVGLSTDRRLLGVSVTQIKLTVADRVPY